MKTRILKLLGLYKSEPIDESCSKPMVDALISKAKLYTGPDSEYRLSELLQGIGHEEVCIGYHQIEDDWWIGWDNTHLDGPGKVLTMELPKHLLMSWLRESPLYT